MHKFGLPSVSQVTEQIEVTSETTTNQAPASDEPAPHFAGNKTTKAGARVRRVSLSAPAQQQKRQNWVFQSKSGRGEVQRPVTADIEYTVKYAHVERKVKSAGIAKSIGRDAPIISHIPAITSLHPAEYKATTPPQHAAGLIFFLTFLIL